MANSIITLITIIGILSVILIPGCKNANAPEASHPGGWTLGDSSAGRDLLGRDVPTPAPTPAILSHEEFAAIALPYISQTHNVPLDELRITPSAVRHFPLTNVTIRVATVDNNKSRVLPSDRIKSWVVAVDSERKIVDPQAVDRAEWAAHVRKYGKIAPNLWERLQKMGPDDSVEVLIWIKGLDNGAIRRRVEKNYPDLYFGPLPPPTKLAYDEKRWSEYYAEVNSETAKAGAALAQPVIDYLKIRGYDASVIKGSAIVEGKLPKWLILEVEKREDVSLIDPMAPFTSGIGKPSLDTAATSVSVPSLWQRGLKGNPPGGPRKKVGIADVYEVNADNPYLSPRVTYVSGPPYTPDEHPTNVAGVAGSAHPLYKGMAYEAEILSADIFPNFIYYGRATFELIAAGAKVINLSWGGDGYLYDFHR